MPKDQQILSSSISPSWGCMLLFVGLFQGFSTLALLHQGLEDSLLQKLSCALKDGSIPSLFPVNTSSTCTPMPSSQRVTTKNISRTLVC